MATKPRGLVGSVMAYATRGPIDPELSEQASSAMPQNEDLSARRRRAALASLARNREALKLLSKA